MAAAVAAAVTAALWALFSHLYWRALAIWMDHGLSFLLRYLVALVRLTYLLRRKVLRFVYLEPEKYNDVIHSGAVCTPVEWSKECPQQRPHLDKCLDEVLFCGVNTEGDRLIVSVSRLRDHVAELWLVLYTRDGKKYSLPTEVTLDRSAGSCYSAAGVRLQCLAANRRWRVAFNGLLRRHDDSSRGPSVESEVHVKLGLIWSTVSHTLEHPAQLAPALLAECCAEGSTLEILRAVKRLTTEMDSYDQAGMMSGEIVVDGEWRELCLWGFKIKNQGNIQVDVCEEDHHIGFLENGDMYHLIRTSKYGAKNGIYYGSVYAPSCEMRSIDYVGEKSKHELKAECGQLHVRGGDYTISVSTKRVSPEVVFYHGHRSCGVVVAAIDLKSENYKGCGLSIALKRSQQSICSLPGYIKHKIIQEHDLRGSSPLVSDIHNECSKMPDLTGGKGSSLAVLHSIAKEVMTFSVPRGFVVTTTSYKLFSSNEVFRKLMREMEASMTGDDWQKSMKDACIKMVGAVERLSMPADIKEAISEHLTKFDKDKMFAVRSSALGEDSEDMSAAGQMTTLLGIRGTENVINAVVKCWASQFSFTNVNYKRQYGQPLDLPMAVVVQELVDADTAGVMFTCDPLTGNPGFITVTANYGIGELVVSASAEPDTFVLKKRRLEDPSIQSSQIGQKSLYTTTSESNGVATVPVSEEKAQRSCISEEDVRALAAIGKQIEKTYTTPQDIEWALQNGNFFMLQCRPVTTFLRESDCELLNEFNDGLKSAKEILTTGNVSEVLPGAPSPLGMSLLRCAFEVNCRANCVKFVQASSPDPSQYMPMWGPMYRYCYFLWLSDGLRKTGNDGNLMEKSIMYSILGRDASSEVEAGVKRMRKITRWKVPVQLFFIAKTMFTVTSGVESASKKTADLHLKIDDTATAAQIYDFMGHALHELREPSILLMKAALSSSFYNVLILRILSTAKGALDNEVFCQLSKILKGTDVESADVPRMIQVLGQVLRESPEKEKFFKMTIEEARHWLSTTESDCGKKYREFIQKHGHRAVKEFDVYTKPWALDPSSLLKSLKAAAAAPEMKQMAPSRWDASQFPYRLSLFQRQYGQPLDLPMAVVVQELVDADTAGVMFTCDPLTGNPGFITVTANYGIGELVVSASAEPDTFVLKKRRLEDPSIQSSQIGQKSLYTTTSESNGVATVPVSEEKAQRSCISEEDVRALAAIGKQIEKTYTTPQDIEWALQNGNFFMLQCRPVTTFLRESDCELLNEFNDGLKSAKEILTTGNVSEVLPGAPSPLGMSLLRCAFEVNCRANCVKFVQASSPDPSQYMPMWGPMYRYCYFLWLSDGLRKTGNDGNLMEKSIMYSILGRDASSEVEAGVKRMRKITRWKVPVQLFFIAKTMFTVTSGVESASKKTADLHLKIDDTATAAQIYDFMGHALHELREPSILLMKAALSSSFYNVLILRILSTAKGALDNEVFCQLSKILKGTDAESADVPRMIQVLGQVLRESPEKEKFFKMTIEEARHWLSTTESDCGKKYREFIQKHGHRAVKEFDVYTKPWALDPSSLLKSLKAAAAAPEMKQMAPSRWDASQFPYRLSLFQSFILKLVAPKARAAVEAREATKSATVRVVHQLRLLCHQLSNRMVQEGRLPSHELLFFLTYEEIGILLRTRSPELVLKAQRRQKIHAKADKNRYPSVFVGIPKPIERLEMSVEGDFEIKGTPMSQGVVEGKVRVAVRFDEAPLIQKGEILVTTATDTGWTPYFPLLAGVVTEIGGPLSHGAVVAREYGLPCVVGIEGITTMLNSGDTIHLDGNTGVIRKIALLQAEDD